PPTPDTPITNDTAATAPAGRDALKRQRWLRRYGLAATGAVIVAVWILIALLSPWLVPYPVEQVDVANRLLPPSAAHWRGTDTLGRDVFSRLLVGSQVSLIAGVVVVAVGGLIGTLIGAAAAYAGGRVEEW